MSTGRRSNARDARTLARLKRLAAKPPCIGCGKPSFTAFCDECTTPADRGGEIRVAPSGFHVASVGAPEVRQQ